MKPKKALVWSRMATLTLLLTLVYGDPDERFFHRGMTMGTKGVNSFTLFQGRIPQEGRLSELCEIVKFLSWNALTLIPCRSPRTKQGVCSQSIGFLREHPRSRDICSQVPGSQGPLCPACFTRFQAWSGNNGTTLPQHLQSTEILEAAAF